MMKRLPIILLALAALLAAAGCTQRTPQAERAERAAHAQGDIVVGAVWPWDSAKGTLWSGIELAMEELNGAGGLLGGRKIRIIKRDDRASIGGGRLIAQEFADNPDVVAVIGHQQSYVSIPASYIYDRAGIVMLTPGSSGQRLTGQGLRYVFRALPGNRDGGRQMAQFAQERGYRRVMVYYVKSDYGTDLANYFEQAADALGLAVVDRRPYEGARDRYGEVLGQWADLYRFDAIFIAGYLPESADIIRAARAHGISAPIFGGVGLDSPVLIEAGGRSVEGTVVFSLYNPDDTRPEAIHFREKFQNRYGRAPDSQAAQGYDTLMLLAHAIRTAGSSAPDKIAAALRATRGWQGATGTHGFDDNGEMVGMRLSRLVVRDGRFALLDDGGAAPRAVASGENEPER